MNDAEIEQIKNEFEKMFAKRRFGKVFQLDRFALAIDFYPHNGGYLFVDINPRERKTYIIKRRLKELERSSVHPSPFVIQLRKLITGKELLSIKKITGSKALRFDLGTEGVPGPEFTLLVQLGGKLANLFLLDVSGTIIGASRENNVAGQSTGEIYVSPVDEPTSFAELPVLNGQNLSELLDAQDCQNRNGNEFTALAAAARKKNNREIAKRRKLIQNLNADLEHHGDADEWKRYGDLILANIANLRRDEDRLFVTDYFDPDLKEIAIEADRNQSPTEAAEAFFKRYTKARNGAEAIVKRLESVNTEIFSLEAQGSRIEAAITAGDEDALSEFLPAKQAVPVPGKRKLVTDDFKGARQFVSSDGFEILVGKKAADNDYLTFRVAKSLDLWLHAADYPGSHVIIKNPNRKEIPDRTLIEAAQLAAFYSDARNIPKAAVNYTQKKFVNKPKRSAPGLVSLASFKTILVEPKVAIQTGN